MRFKDYQIKDGVLYKKRIIESKHLMWQPGMDGCPCIDMNLWLKNWHLLNRIEFHTDKGRTFLISREDFDANKKLIDYGFGKQFWAPKEFWTIKQPTKEQELKQLCQNANL